MDTVELPGVIDSPSSAALGVSSPLRSPATPLSQPQTPIYAPQASSTAPTFFSKIRPSKSLENDENEHQYNPEEVYK